MVLLCTIVSNVSEAYICICICIYIYIYSTKEEEIKRAHGKIGNHLSNQSSAKAKH